MWREYDGTCLIVVESLNPEKTSNTMITIYSWKRKMKTILSTSVPTNPSRLARELRICLLMKCSGCLLLFGLGALWTNIRGQISVVFSDSIMVLSSLDKRRMSHNPIPNGVAYENFELVQDYFDGQRFILGVTELSPTQLESTAKSPEPP